MVSFCLSSSICPASNAFFGRIDVKEPWIAPCRLSGSGGPARAMRVRLRPFVDYPGQRLTSKITPVLKKPI